MNRMFFNLIIVGIALLWAPLYQMYRFNKNPEFNASEYHKLYIISLIIGIILIVIAFLFYYP